MIRIIELQSHMRVRSSNRLSSCLALLASLPVTGLAQFALAPGNPFPAATLPFAAAAAYWDGRAFTAASLNRNGRSDLVGINPADNTIAVRLSDGKGGFTTPTGKPLTVGAGSFIVAAADFNRDGRTDLVVLTGTGTFTVLLGNDAGGFGIAPGSPFQVTGLNLGVATVGDFNGDGRLDLAIANDSIPNTSGDKFSLPGTNSVIVLLGNGAGSFHAAPGSPFSAGTMSIESLAAGDFNKDGIQDLAVGYYGDAYYQLLVLLGSHSGTLTPVGSYPVRIQGVEGGTASIVVADFNGDGISDVAVAATSFSHGIVTVRLGDGAGGFKTSFNSGGIGFPRSLTVEDFNGDGKPDFAVTFFSASVDVYFGDGTGVGFGAGPQIPGDPPPANFAYVLSNQPSGSEFVVGDFNGDGKPDILLTDFQTVALLLNSLPAITASPATITFYSAAGVSVAPLGDRVRVNSTLPGSTWTATFSQPWLSATPATSATGGPATVTISVKHAPAPGTYSGIVRYGAPGFFGAETVVKLHVLE
jgi:hypothetical protein